ncbi:MAG: hypothetical protein ACLTSX_12655 [Collinsella sp.]
MYDIGCDALEQIDAALDANDLFSDDLQTQLQTLSVEARNVENQQENDAEILEGIQGAAISIALDNGDDAMDYIDQLREALGRRAKKKPRCVHRTHRRGKPNSFRKEAIAL